MSRKIFISYRREDSQGVTGRLYDRLENHFGRDHIFMDVDTIQPGMDFVEAIEKAVSAADDFLVVIGPNWTESMDAAGNRRLENPQDFVRLEVATALARDVRVIPVLVNTATMPDLGDLPDNIKHLSRRNALEISHTRFSTDVDRLIHVLENISEPLDKTQDAMVQEVPKIDAVQKPLNDESRTKTEKSNLSQLLISIICWTIGGAIGGYFHWSYGYALVYAGVGGFISGIGLGIALRNGKPDSWIIQLPIAILGSITVGYFVRSLLGLNFGGDISISLMIFPLVTALLYGLWKTISSKTRILG
jgi:hypothetical protein